MTKTEVLNNGINFGFKKNNIEMEAHHKYFSTLHPVMKMNIETLDKK